MLSEEAIIIESMDIKSTNFLSFRRSRNKKLIFWVWTNIRRANSLVKSKFRKFENSTPGMTSQGHKTGYKWDHDNFGRNSIEKFIFLVWSNIGILYNTVQ